MRIFALVTDAFGGHGGIAKFNRDFLSALCAFPEVSSVVAIPRLMPEEPEGQPENLRFDSVGVGGKWRYLRAVLRTVFRERTADLIICGHIHLLPLAFLSRRLLRMTESRSLPPIALVIHGIDAWRPTRSWLVNWLASKSDALITVSEFTRCRFLNWAGAASRMKTFLLPNCVDLQHFTPGAKNQSLLERYGLTGRIVLLTVARLSAQERYKGIDEVMETLPALLERIPNLRYLIVGEGADRVRLEHKAAELGIAQCVIFAGYIPDAEKVDHFRLADAYVMPGYGEGFGVAYLEALACGVPVLASKLDASGEALRGGELGILVNPTEPAEIHAGIVEVLRKPSGVVPAGLSYFSRENFDKRAHAIVNALTSRAPLSGRVRVEAVSTI